jgi:hypothetical protein
MNDEDFSKMTLGKSISLKRQNASPDELMRVEIEKITALAPPAFIVAKYLIPDKINPTLMNWFNNSITCSRHGDIYHSKIQCEWFSDIQSFILTRDLSLNGINISTQITTLSFNILQEDPRLISIKKNELFAISYTSKHTIYDKFIPTYVIGKFNKKNNNIEFDRSVNVLQNDVDFNGKNWVPFAKSNNLYFIQKINPLHIIELNITTGTLRSLLKSNKTVHLPWKSVYGTEIRGGSPAILIRGTYLSFFHTVAFTQRPWNLRNYFMGAISFCPDSPHSIHMMSSYPIVDEEWYLGKWTQHDIAYTIFPTGLMYDSTIDVDHIFLSLGLQDVNGLILKIHVDTLFHSMRVVHDCGA